MSNNAKRCFRCQSELPKDSGYCLSCGFQNVDLAAKKAKAEIDADARQEKLKTRAAFNRGVFWFFRLFGR